MTLWEHTDHDGERASLSDGGSVLSIKSQRHEIRACVRLYEPARRSLRDALTATLPDEARGASEPELLTADTGLYDDMTARTSGGLLWTYDASTDVWQYRHLSLSTRRLIEADAVIVP